MTPRAKAIRKLVDEGQYVIDEAAVAEAIIVRSVALRLLPEVTFRTAASRETPVRSFRPHRGVRSFRLSRPQRRPPHVRGARPKPIV
jgi:hypothetical protein